MGLKVGAIMKYVKEFADGSKIATQRLNGKTITEVTKGGKRQFIRAKSVERYPVGDKNVVTIKKALRYTQDRFDKFTVLDKVYSQKGNLLGKREQVRGLSSSGNAYDIKDLTCGNTSKKIRYNNSGIRTYAESGDGRIEFNPSGLPQYNVFTAGFEKLV